MTHEIKIVHHGPIVRWKCSCGTGSNIWTKSAEEAQKRADKHLRRHSSAEADAALQADL